MKTVRIKNTVNSADMNTLQIYHTSITGSNLLTSSVSQSGVFTGQDLFDGLEFQVEDNIEQFYVKNLTRCVNIGSGSLSENSNAVFYYFVSPGTNASVTITGQSTTTTISNSTTRHNFSLYPTLTIESTPTYPDEFQSWYSNSAFTGSALSSNNPVTITSGSFGGITSWYAKLG